MQSDVDGGARPVLLYSCPDSTAGRLLGKLYLMLFRSLDVEAVAMSYGNGELRCVE